MCWCWPFGSNAPKRKKPTSSSPKKRKDGYDSLHGDGIPIVAEPQEKRKPKAKAQPEKRRSREHVSQKESPRRQQRTREYTVHDYRPRQEHRTREPQRPNLNVQVPNMWQRSVAPASASSSTEMLLNPRPHRSPGHHRQRHPKRTSQTTLRGRGAKRDPPSRKKSTPKTGWTALFAPSPPKTPQRRERTHYQPVHETSPRSDRSSRHQGSSPRSDRSSRHRRSSRAADYGTMPQTQAQAQPQPYSRPIPQPYTATRRQRTRSRTPNTAARRTPDRRFAVLAATNQALEELRQEAFAYPSPGPSGGLRGGRRERVARVDGYVVPTSSMPFHWDCVSSQTSASVGGSGRRR